MQYKPRPVTKVVTIKRLAAASALTPLQVQRVLEQLAVMAIAEAKNENSKNSFLLPYIGRLMLLHRPSRPGRNPRTGEVIQVQAKDVVKFRLEKAFKQAILKVPVVP